MGIALGCAVAALLAAVAVATGHDGGPDSASGGDRALVSTHDLVLRREALPCTGPEELINFEIFSAGPAVAGLPLAATVRRCDAAAPADEAPANYVAYIYGDCEIAEGATGCAPPLQIHTWPACQRAMAHYSFEGKPLPHKKLPKRDGAEVVEFDFALETRLEVYTKSATIVIFASDPALARKAVGLLRSQEKGKPPVTQADDLGGGPPERLGPPTDGSMEGALSC